jgi:hypothetical protein
MRLCLVRELISFAYTTDIRSLFEKSYQVGSQYGITCYDRPSLASHLSARGNFECVGNDVSARVEVNDFATRVLWKCSAETN